MKIRRDLSRIHSLPKMQKSVANNGKHTACGEQHELITHTEVFNAQVYVVLLQACKIEQSIPGAQYRLLLTVR